MLLFPSTITVVTKDIRILIGYALAFGLTYSNGNKKNMEVGGGRNGQTLVSAVV